MKARCDVVDDRTAHGVVLCTPRLLRYGKAVGESVEGLLKLALMEEGLGFAEQVPFQLLQLVLVHVLSNLRTNRRGAFL